MPVQLLSKSIRDTIYQRVLDAVRAELGGEARLVGRCLEFAWQGYQILKPWPGAARTIIQAGSACWPSAPSWPSASPR